MGLFDKNTVTSAVRKSDFSETASWRTGILQGLRKKKLSPFFSERRNSTVEDIRRQLAYRAEK